MRYRFGRCLFVSVSLVLLVGLVTVVVGTYAVRRSFPQVDGSLTMPGLHAPVEIYRDALGVPHIYASTEHDLLMAQGFVHAQDRFWQMDFQRHASSGRLSELVGQPGLDIDMFVRTLGWERVARQDVARLDAGTATVLQAYADGVNAYLHKRGKGSALSLEYVFLGLINPGYAPAPWTPRNSLTWAKAMAWVLGDNLDLEIRRAVLLNSLTSEQVADLFPPYPTDHPVILPDFGLASQADWPAFDPVLAPLDLSRALQTVEARGAALDAVLGSRGEAVGSNSWVISGELTVSGGPLLANDPHLAAQIPSLWHQIGLHCAPKTPACPYDLAGFSLLGIPGVVIGHNDRIAWGLTDVTDDVQDLFIERINPNNPNQYEANEEWVDMELVQETIEVARGDPVELTVRLTRHGPIISEVFDDLQGFAERTNLELPGQHAIALRWTGFEPSTIFSAILKINRAQNWDEFREAAREFDVPAQNLVYADVDGNIGYQTPGRIPIRAGGDGTLPVPGWTEDYEWVGFIPFEELPFALNPPAGYIVAANNAIVGTNYPHRLSLVWDYGFRAKRIVDMIEASPKPIAFQFVQDMQVDNKNLNAETLVPILLSLRFEDQRQEEVRSILIDWDYQQHMDLAAPALFEAFWKQLLAATFHDDLPEEQWPQGGSGWFEIVRRLVKDPQSLWWDDRNTAQIETRDQLFEQAFQAAVVEMEASLGREVGGWSWGDLHTITFRNEVMNGFPLVGNLFNRGPYRTSGSSAVVNNVAWNTAETFEASGTLPSLRIIVDLSDLANSVGIHTTGQSGHAYHPHYIDMVDRWRDGEYHLMHWTLDPGRRGAESHLTLIPSSE